MEHTYPRQLGLDRERKDQWFPWIAADPMTGNLVCIFYDSRNFAGNDMAETFVALSKDGGQTWEDFKVSDFAWPADGYPGFAPGYAGDYIGIDILAGRMYPVWTDTRTGVLLTYASPIELDTDSDGIGDAHDNCTTFATTPPSPPQLDVDQDGFGNICDQDMDQNNVAGASDFITLRACFGKQVGPGACGGQPGCVVADPDCAESDFDGNGVVGATDFSTFRLRFGLPPGPSGLLCAGTIPCP